MLLQATGSVFIYMQQKRVLQIEIDMERFYLKDLLMEYADVIVVD